MSLQLVSQEGVSTTSSNKSNNNSQYYSTMMEPDSTQQQDEGSQRVEVATLRLPPEAYREGIRTGEGTNVILEHHPEALNNDHETDQLKQSSTSMPVIVEEQEEEPHRHWNANIEAVVDLQAMQKLVVGASEQEFHSMIRKTDETDPEVDTSGGPQHTPIQYAYEEPPTSQTTLALSADPFVDTLASMQQNDQQEGSQSNSQKHHLPPDEPLTVETTLDDEDQLRYAHEGFLLSVQQEEDDLETGTYATEKKEDASYVLALPQIMPSETAFHDPSQLADDDMTSIASDASLFQNQDTVPSFHFTRFPEETELPSDIVSVELRATLTDAHSTTDTAPLFASAAHGTAEEDTKALQLDLVVERQTPKIGYFILGTSLIAMSSMGAAVNLMGMEANAILKNCWRIQATVCCLLPMALTGKNRFSTEVAKLTWVEWTVHLPLCGFAFFVMSTAFVVALEMTSLANVFVLSNLPSLIIIAGKAVVGAPILLLEGWGAAIGLIGSIVCGVGSRDGAAETMHQSTLTDAENLHARLLQDSEQEGADSSRALLGNLIAFLSSVGVAAYLTIAQQMRHKLDLYVFMLLLFSCACLYNLLYLACFVEDWSISRDPMHGLFGWINLSSNRLPLVLYIAAVCNIVGCVGYVAVLKYFDPVVVTMTMLLEPVLAACLGVLVGVGTMPGKVTWIGDGIVAVGSLMVIFSKTRKIDKIDATGTIMDPFKRNDEGGRGRSLSEATPLVAKYNEDKASKYQSNGTYAASGADMAHSLPQNQVIWE